MRLPSAWVQGRQQGTRMPWMDNRGQVPAFCHRSCLMALQARFYIITVVMTIAINYIALSTLGRLAHSVIDRDNYEEMQLGEVSHLPAAERVRTRAGI